MLLSWLVLQGRGKRSVCGCCQGTGEEECSWCHGTGQQGQDKPFSYQDGGFHLLAPHLLLSR